MGNTSLFNSAATFELLAPSPQLEIATNRGHRFAVCHPILFSNARTLFRHPRVTRGTEGQTYRRFCRLRGRGRYDMMPSDLVGATPQRVREQIVRLQSCGADGEGDDPVIE